MLLLRGGLALERGGSALSELSQIASLGCTNGEAQTDTLLSRQALLEACERQEQHTLEQYERVLQMNLPTDVATLVRQQHSQVAAALRSIGAWKPF
jgi:hypothetical protein